MQDDLDLWVGDWSFLSLEQLCQSSPMPLGDPLDLPMCLIDLFFPLPGSQVIGPLTVSLGQNVARRAAEPRGTDVF